MKIRKENVNWKQVMLGRVPGILLGARGAFTDTIETGESEVLGEHHLDAVSDEMSFGDAFSAARAELGQGGVFEWRGNLYATDTIEEWNASHPQEDNQDEIPVEQEVEENEVVIFGEADAEDFSEVMVIDTDDNGNDDFADVLDNMDAETDSIFTDAESYDTDLTDDGCSNDIL